MELHEDSQQTECRLTVKMICGLGEIHFARPVFSNLSNNYLGVIKSYKLTYEPAAIQHAVFDKSKATSMWATDPKFLKQLIDHFSLSAEQLDMYTDSGRAVFTSFTTKIMEGKGMHAFASNPNQIPASHLTPNRSLKTPSPHLRRSRQTRFSRLHSRRKHARGNQPKRLQSNNRARRNSKCNRNSTLHPTLQTPPTRIQI
jgi:hypothetical protein